MKINPESGRIPDGPSPIQPVGSNTSDLESLKLDLPSDPGSKTTNNQVLENVNKLEELELPAVLQAVADKVKEGGTLPSAWSNIQANQGGL